MRGYGVGKQGAALTLRDLGISSQTQMEKGITLGLEMGSPENEGNITEAQTEQQRQIAQIQAQQQQQQINQDWLSKLETLRLGEGELAVSSASALAANRTARADAELKLIQMSAEYGIDVQAYLDAIGGASGLGYYEEADQVLGGVAAQFR